MPEPSGQRTLDLARLMFQSSVVRTLTIAGRIWFVLKDITEILKYRDATAASRILKGHQKGTHKVCTLGGTQEMIVVSEGGVYRLFVRSRHPMAEEIQDWLEEDLSPASSGRALLVSGKSRVQREQREFGCDAETTKPRVEQFALNRKLDTWLAAEEAAHHTHPGCPRGSFGVDHRDEAAALAGLADTVRGLGHRAIAKLPRL